MKRIIPLLFLITSVIIPAYSLEWELSNGILTISGNEEMPNFHDNTEQPWACCDIKTVIIKEGVKSIGDFAFANNDTIKSVLIPNSVKFIGKKAFCNTNGLEELIIPKGVKTIKEGAFWFNESLKEVELKGVECIEPFGFYCCSSLESVKIGDGLEKIGANAFEGCNNLKSINVPDSVYFIGDSAFLGCNKIKKQKNDYIISKVDNTLIAYCGSQKDVTIPSQIKKNRKVCICL